MAWIESGVSMETGRDRVESVVPSVSLGVTDASLSIVVEVKRVLLSIPSTLEWLYSDISSCVEIGTRPLVVLFLIMVSDIRLEDSDCCLSDKMAFSKSSSWVSPKISALKGTSPSPTNVFVVISGLKTADPLVCDKASSFDVCETTVLNKSNDINDGL